MQIWVRTFSDSDSVCVEIEDNGAGLAPEACDRVFEPFWTTKSPDQGTGLGLSIVQGIVTDYGGTVACDSTAGAGATFLVSLPVSPKS